MSKKIESITKKLPIEENPASSDLNCWILPNILKTNTNPQTFLNTEEEGTFSNSIQKARISLILKPGKDIRRK